MFLFSPRKKIKIRYKKERFTIGIVKLPIVKRSVPELTLLGRMKRIKKLILKKLKMLRTN